jgi:MFS transporter, DHA1 family, tetracycline resistance protein
MTIHKHQQLINLFILLFVVFVDLFGVGVVIPILPIIFSDNKLFTNIDNSLLPVFYGLLIAMYPIGQLFGAPIFGYLSDIFGRKKILILSIFGTSLSYLLFSFALFSQNLVLMFVSRLIDGFTGGNIFITQSMILDMSNNENRNFRLGLINIPLGLGLVLGPLLGGIISEFQIYNINGYVFPYLLAFILAFMNIIFCLFFLKNTNENHRNTSQLDIFSTFHNIKKAFKVKYLSQLFLVSFIYSIAFAIFINFFPQYLTLEFSFTSKYLGFIAGYLGIWLGISVLVFLPLFNAKFGHVKSLYLGLFVVAISFLLILIPSNSVWLYLILPFVALGMSLVSTSIISSISDQVQVQNQGEMLGINQSVQALGTTSPIIGGLLSSIWTPLPILVSSLLLLVAFWIVYFRFRLMV